MSKTVVTGIHKDVYFETEKDKTIGLWKKIEEAAKQLEMDSPSEFVRYACKKALKFGDVGSAKDAILKNMKKQFENVSVEKGAGKNVRVEVDNLKDDQRVHVRVSFFNQDKDGKVVKVSKKLSFFREGRKIVVGK